jgi:hypothetical protein
VTEFIPVEHNPFAGSYAAAVPPPQFEPVDHDPFVKQKEKPFSGTILPFSKDEQGNVSFDSNAGIVGAIKRAVTLPRDVVIGKVQLPSSEGIPGSIAPDDPGADEALSRIREAATVVNPVNPAIASGGAVIAGATDAIPKITVRPSAVRAAQTAVEMGAPLPRGVATENTGVQALTHGVRSLPYVGQKIDARLGATADAANTALATDAQALSGGINARADVGESLRAPLQGTIEKNKGDINAAFGELRQAINPDAPIAPNNLVQALRQVAQSRQDSGWANPVAGLDNFVNLARSGASFNGLQRARSELAETLDFGAAHGGFTAGDKKLLMSGLTKDMEEAVKTNVRQPPVELGATHEANLAGQPRSPVSPERAMDLFKSANETFQRLSGENKNVATILGSQRDTLLAGRIVSAANGKTGDPKLLAQLKAGLPEQDFGRVAGTVLHELGKNQSGEFSLNLFSKHWSQIGDRQKSILFGDRKKFYDDIANLSSFVKRGEQYKNTSGTARAETIATVLGGLATGATASIMTGSPIPLAGAVGGLAGGYTLAKALASPRGAASVARMTRAAQNYAKLANPVNRAALTLAVENAKKTLEDLGSSGSDLIHHAESPSQEAP